MKFAQWLCEAAGKTLYHVTMTSSVPKIMKNGIIPLQKSNWVKSKSKARYGGGNIFAFDHMKDAVRWAAKMDWAFNQEWGTGKISIITFQEDEPWGIDDADPLSQANKSGSWLKREKFVSPDQIVKVQPFTPDMVKLLA